MQLESQLKGRLILRFVAVVEGHGIQTVPVGPVQIELEIPFGRWPERVTNHDELREVNLGAWSALAGICSGTGFISFDGKPRLAKVAGTNCGGTWALTCAMALFAVRIC